MNPNCRLSTKSSLLALLIASLGLQAGCGQPFPTMPAARKDTVNATAEAEAAIKTAPPSPKAAFRQVVTSDEPYMGSGSFELPNGVPLPSRLERPDAVSINFPNPVTLSELATTLTRRLAVPVVLGRIGDAEGQDIQIAPKVVVIPSTSTSRALDRIAEIYGVSWKYDGGGFTLFNIETRTFVIYASPNDQAKLEGGANTRLSGSGGGGGSGGRGGSTASTPITSQRVETSGTLKLWDDLKAGVEKSVGPTGKVVVSTATQSITVTAPPSGVRAAAEYLRGQNERLARVISLDLRIVTVTREDEDDFGVDLTTVLKNAIPGVTLGSLSPTSLVSPGAASLSMAVINPPPGSTASKWDGSRAVLNALSSQGTVSTVYHLPAVTANQNPVSANDLRAIPYLDAIPVYAGTPTTSPITGLQSARETEGISISLFPQIYDQSRFALRLDLTISRINDIVNLDAGTGGKIQGPDTSTQTYNFYSPFRSGATLVLSGLNTLRSQSKETGTITPEFLLPGGSKLAKRSRMMTAIVVSGRVLSSPLTEVLEADVDPAASGG
jgi:type IVB pilus formation R64 PilN family outer membrane protein